MIRNEPEMHPSVAEAGEVIEAVLTALVDAAVRLIVAAPDGLRMGVLSSGEQDIEWLRLAVRRQLQALLG